MLTAETRAALRALADDLPGKTLAELHSWMRLPDKSGNYFHINTRTALSAALKEIAR